MQQKCNKLEAKIVKLETEQNSLAQYGRKNNIVISGIPDSIDDNNLENTVISMMSDININIEGNDVEASHRFGKPDVRSKYSRAIVKSEKLSQENVEVSLFNKCFCSGFILTLAFLHDQI